MDTNFDYANWDDTKDISPRGIRNLEMFFEGFFKRTRGIDYTVKITRVPKGEKKEKV